MINIPKTIDDPFYRYQREEIKISSQKIGIRIDNLDIISKSIYLKPKTVIKHLQKKLGCQSKNDILYNKNTNAIELEKLLEELITDIICSSCNNPEIKIYKEKKRLLKKCNACGGSSMIEESLQKILLHEIN